MYKFPMLVILQLVLVAFSLHMKVCHSRQTNYDPFIVCSGPRITRQDGLPLGYSEETYSTALALCSLAHGAPQNAGCSCISSGGRVYCDENVADSTLFNAWIQNGMMTIAGYCTNIGCYCRTMREEQNANSNTQTASASINIASPLPSRVVNPLYDSTGPNPFRDIAGGFSTTDQSCGVGCRSDKDCQSCAPDQITADKYHCRAAQQSKFNPTTGAATFFSMCLISASTSSLNGKNNGIGGKRDVEFPCPCNTTYISHSCCGANDGLVWEPVGFNLGKLVGGGDL